MSLQKSTGTAGPTPKPQEDDLLNAFSVEPAEPPPEPTTKPYALPTALDWSAINQDFKVIDFVFPGLTAGGLGMLAAPGGTGKSFTMLALAASVAMGKPLLPGWPEHDPAKAYMFFAEDPPDIIHNRLRHLLRSSWVQGNNPSESKAQLLMDNLTVRSMLGEDCTLSEASQYEKKLYRTDFARALEEEATLNDARLIVLDPMRQFHMADENDSAQMTELLKLLHGIAYRSKSALIFAHHTNKTATASGQGDAQHAARGSSAITDNVRWQANMISMQDDDLRKYGILEEKRKQYVRLALSKANYTNAASDVWFKRGEGGILEPVTLNHMIPKTDLNFGGVTSLPNVDPARSMAPKLTTFTAPDESDDEI